MNAAHAAAPTAAVPRTRGGRSHVAARRRRGRPESVLAPFAVFAVVAGLLLAFALIPAAGDTTPPTATRRVRVAAADTLWSIAQSNPVDGMSTAQAVEEIRRLNDFGAAGHLQPGIVIAVPSAAVDSSNLAMR